MIVHEEEKQMIAHGDRWWQWGEGGRGEGEERERGKERNGVIYRHLQEGEMCVQVSPTEQLSLMANVL